MYNNVIESWLLEVIFQLFSRPIIDYSTITGEDNQYQLFYLAT